MSTDAENDPQQDALDLRRQQQETTREVLIARTESLAEFDYASIEYLMAADDLRLRLHGTTVDELPTDRRIQALAVLGNLLHHGALAVLGNLLHHGALLLNRDDDPELFRGVFDLDARHPNVEVRARGRLLCAYWVNSPAQPQQPIQQPSEPGPQMNGNLN